MATVESTLPRKPPVLVYRYRYLTSTIQCRYSQPCFLFFGPKGRAEPASKVDYSSPEIIVIYSSCQ